MDDTPGLTKKFSRLNTAVFPDFYSYNTSLERGLWVLLVAKDKLKIKKLTAEEVAIIIRDVKEISIDARSITNAFNRAGNKVHIHEKKFFEIMNPGRELLYSQISKGAVEILYFEAGKRYSSKRCMSQEFLEGLKGDLKIVDPYPGERTLDILSKVKNRIKFLTRIDNLKSTERATFSRELNDFKTEYGNIECRNYLGTDIHDRYILSAKSLVILGHSIKDLGGKESFALMLDAQTNKNIIDTLTDNFDRRWGSATVL